MGPLNTAWSQSIKLYAELYDVITNGSLVDNIHILLPEKLKVGFLTETAKHKCNWAFGIDNYMLYIHPFNQHNTV